MGTVRSLPVAMIASLAVVGCGGSRTRQADPSRSSAPPPQAAAGSSASPLVNFRRTVGFDPMSSELTIWPDGRARAIVTYGGRNGEKKHLFTIPRGQLARLRRMLEHTRVRSTSCCNVNLYIYFLVAGGHSARLQQGRIPRSLRPLIDELNTIADAHLNR